MKSEVINLNKERNVTLTTYLLDSSNEFSNIEARPAILVLPGGGYSMCSAREAEPIAMAYLAEGYQAFVLRYSVAENSTWPNPLNDAENALEMIRANSAVWGIDQERIAVIGFSAGGHLAAALSTIGKVKPNAMILGYPCILKEIENILSTPIPGLENAVDRNTPPAFLFTTRDDALVPARNSLSFMNALDKAGIPFEAHVFYTGQHGLSLAKAHTSSGAKSNVNSNVAKWFALSVDWLKQVFGEFKADIEFSVSASVDDNTAVYTADNSMRNLLQNEECNKVLISYLPMLADSSKIQAMMGISLRMLSQYAKDMISEEMLIEIEEKLKGIPKAEK